MNKIKAFTLTELLIGMVISSIVIGIAYYGYSAVNEQLHRYQKIKFEMTELLQLKSNLESEFFEAETVTLEEKRLLFLGKDTLEYLFDDSLIYRKSNDVLDTFRVNTNNISISSIDGSKTGELVNEFSFDASMFEQTQRLSFFKDYGANTILNNMPNRYGNNRSK